MIAGLHYTNVQVVYGYLLELCIVIHLLLVLCSMVKFQEVSYRVEIVLGFTHAWACVYLCTMKAQFVFRSASGYMMHVVYLLQLHR